MPKVTPFHSVKPGESNVYHDNSACTENNTVEPQYLRAGKGGFPQCDNCRRLEEQGN